MRIGYVACCVDFLDSDGRWDRTAPMSFLRAYRLYRAEVPCKLYGMTESGQLILLGERV
jgi:hypothetical protein